MSETVRNGFGDFLRSRRGKLTPESVGLPAGRRRRTSGLRREEVAELAGIGVDWYVRLEQGRSVSPSTTTVSALARALRLDETEKRHLQALAANPQRRAFERETAPTITRRLVEGLGEPAYLTGRRWDLLAWNAAAAELFTDFGRRAEDDRKILVYLLLDPAARLRFGPGWAEQARHVVAQFRAVHDLWAPDAAFTDLSTRLRNGCPEFGVWWDAHQVVAGGAGRKTLHHPVNGPLTYDYATLQANEAPALRLSIYTAARLLSQAADD